MYFFNNTDSTTGEVREGSMYFFNNTDSTTGEVREGSMCFFILTTLNLFTFTTKIERRRVPYISS